MSMFLYGAFAGVLCGGFIGCLTMALVQINRFEDDGIGTDDPRLRDLTIREQYERECY